MLVSYDLIDFSYEVISYHALPDDSLRLGISALIKSGDLLYIAFKNDLTRIVVYDFITNTYHEYYEDLSSSGMSKPPLTLRAQVNDGMMYLFPYFTASSDRIMRFDMKSQNFIEPLDLYPKANDIPEERELWTYDSHNKLFAFEYRGNRITVISKTGEARQYYHLSEEVSIENVACFEDCFYITSFADNLLRVWNEEDGVIDTCECNGIKRNSDFKLNIWRVIKKNRKLILTPFTGGTISLIDIQTKKEKTLDTSKYCKHIHESYSLYYDGYVFVEDRVLLLPGATDSFLWIDMNNGNITPISARLKEEDVGAALFKQRQRGKMERMYEDRDISLKGVLNGLESEC